MSPIRWIELCPECKQHGFGHAFDCTCHTTALPVTPPAVPEPMIPEMDAFTRLQLQRDRVARIDNQTGDLCKRWVTCTRCQWTSEPVAFWSDMDQVEDDHMMHGCDAPAPVRPEPDGVTWPYPEPWIFTYRIEPAERSRRARRPRYDWAPVAGRRAPIVLRLPAKHDAERDAA